MYETCISRMNKFHVEKMNFTWLLLPNHRMKSLCWNDYYNVKSFWTNCNRQYLAHDYVACNHIFHVTLLRFFIHCLKWYRFNHTKFMITFFVANLYLVLQLSAYAQTYRFMHTYDDKHLIMGTWCKHIKLPISRFLKW
jgi:hypothetical protein